MPSHDFEFDLRVDAGEGAGALSDALAAEVLRHLGYAADVVEELGSSIAAAVRDICTPRRACHIRFRVAAGELEVAVSAGPQATRRIVRALPA